jgi:serine O-acetyltransferase
MRLSQLLLSDLARQLEIENQPEVRPSLLLLLGRALHHRFFPILLCRAARATLLSGIPILPKMLTYLNIVLFGLEVTPQCEIGPGLFFPHTSGTVVGACRLGRNITIFQGVTLGAKELDMTFEPSLRPTVGDYVTLGAGCKILGGVHLGDHVVVGANSVVLDSVDSNTTVVGIPARKICSEVAHAR